MLTTAKQCFPPWKRVKAFIEKKTFFIMAAPKRAPTVPTAPELLPHDSSLFAQTEAPSRPVRVRAPGTVIDQNERSLIRFSQVIMLCIALCAIWLSIYRIAFDDEASNNDFAVLFFGGMISAGMAIGWIEVQSRANDHQLRDVQDYMLGIGFFFSTVGAVWGARFIIGLFEEQGTFGANILDDTGAWYPNGNGVYVQTLALLGVMLIQHRLLHHFKGQTSFGWAIASYAPMVVLLGAGMNTWLRWSGGEVSYELGISLIVLCVASMEMALRSNNSVNLTVIVIASGLTPLLFEAAHSGNLSDSADKGGALSLLVFVLAIQGYYASKQELRKDIIQKASIVLISVIVLAMVYARGAELNLILGPLRFEALGSLGTYVTLSSMLWISVLVFYFPAMLDQRLPWIPIGLAFALMIIPNSESAIPWLITVAILPYMLLISKATRKWVANATLSTAAIAYLVVDLYAWDIGIAQSESFGLNGLHFLIPLALITISEFSQRKQKTDLHVHLLVVATVALSRAVINTQEWYTTWAFAVYLLYLARSGFSNLETGASLKSRWEASLRSLMANAVIVTLVLFEAIQIPEELIFRDYKLHVFFFGALSYGMLLNGRGKEFDLGMMFSWTGSMASGAPQYNASTNTWIESPTLEQDQDMFIEKYSWSPLSRISMIVPLIMMSSSMFAATSFLGETEAQALVIAPYILLLLVAPIACLVWEILALPKISSQARASAVWLLFAIGLAPSFVFNGYRVMMEGDPDYIDKNILPGMLLLDFMLVAAPFIVAWAISKRGLDTDAISVKADLSAMIGLVALACLDTSGGLLMIPMLILVTYYSVKHRQNVALMLAPVALILTANSWLELNGIGRLLTERIDLLEQMSSPSGLFGLSAASGFLITLQMAYVLLVQILPSAKNIKKSLPWIGAWAWLAVGLMSMFPELDWFQWTPLFITAVLMLNSWYNGQIQFLSLLLIAEFISLWIALASTSNALSDLDIFSWSMFVTGVTAMLYSALHENGVLHANKDKEMSEPTMFTIPNLKTDEDREQLNEQFQIIGYLGLGFSISILWGIGTVIGAALLTRTVISKGLFNLTLFAPLVHSLVLYNFLIRSEILPTDALDMILGLVLLAEGIAFTLISIKNDGVYDYKAFDWPSDQIFFEFMDRLGLVGVGTTIASIFLIFNGGDTWTTLAFSLTTVVLIGVGIQGYTPEFEARWRRLVGGYGSIITTFITANTLSFVSETIVNIGYMFGAIVTIGWIFMSSSRLGDSNDIYTPGPGALTEPVIEVEAVLPVAEPQGEVAEEEDLDEAVEDEDPEAEAEEAVEETPEPVKETLDIPPPVVSKERVQTNHGFEIELPDDMFNTILASIETTPHEGFKPVVAFGPRGEVVLNFEPQ